jgi:hypothetical protein
MKDSNIKLVFFRNKNKIPDDHYMYQVLLFRKINLANLSFYFRKSFKMSELPQYRAMGADYYFM